ncbi:MAG: phage holin family protein [Actinomycetota bacterium]
MSDRPPTTEDLYKGDGGGAAATSATGVASGGAQGSGSAAGGGAYGTSREGGKSAGKLMKEITEDLSSLFRKEIELAKQEIGGQVKEKAVGGAIIAIGGFFGLLALMFLLLGLRDGFDTFLWTWVADIATAVVLILIGVVAALVARKKLRKPISADLTKQTVKEDIEWAKSIGKR